MIKYFELGLIEYDTVVKFQDRLQQLRAEGRIVDVLLLLEHPPTMTFGKSGGREDILYPQETLKKSGISLFTTDRGGSITCHGPGQLVGYPIFDLALIKMDVHRYIFKLQEVIIRTLKDYDIQAERDQNHVGVWVGQNKIAAIGINVKKGITKHGFALNVNNSLDHFSLIHPCGITDRGVTSISALLGEDIPLDELTDEIISHFSYVFKQPLEPMKDLEQYLSKF